jgi:hypothetical protein
MDATESATDLTTESPPDAPPTELTARERSNANLNRGVPANVERGPDGKLRKKGSSASPDGQNVHPDPPRVLSTVMEDDLTVMRQLLCTTAEDDTSFQRVRLRRWLDEDLKGFMQRLDRLAARERAATSAEATSAEGMEEEEDEGLERARELMQRLLRSYEESQHGPPRALEPDAPLCGSGSHI